MAKIDHVLERLRGLSVERQEALIDELDLMLEREAGGSYLTDAQWAEVEASLADTSEPTRAHDDVFADLRASLTK